MLSSMPHAAGFPPVMNMLVQLLLAFPFVLVLFLYLWVVLKRKKRGKTWSVSRTAFWVTGCLLALLSVAGPIAHLAHHDFKVHMVTHLMLGMMAPLLFVLAAPMTLLLNTLRVEQARSVARLLRSRYSRVVTHPVTATILNIGGLWVLYTTDLYSFMHENFFIYLFVHVHVFLAGYLFTASMIYIDPTPHRFSFLYRSIVLILALAAHGVLSKYIYAQPPIGVPSLQAEQGAKLMYYGGDFIDAVIIFVLCLHWFRWKRPKEVEAAKV